MNTTEIGNSVLSKKITRENHECAYNLTSGFLCRPANVVNIWIGHEVILCNCERLLDEAVAKQGLLYYNLLHYQKSFW